MNLLFIVLAISITSCVPSQQSNPDSKSSEDAAEEPGLVVIYRPNEYVPEFPGDSALSPSLEESPEMAPVESPIPVIKPAPVLPPPTVKPKCVYKSRSHCGFNFTSMYEGSHSLHCRLNYQFPHKETEAAKTPIQKIEFYTNCGTCEEGALYAENGRTWIGSPVSSVSSKQCEMSRIVWDVQGATCFSFWVETLSDSTCTVDYDRYFAFASSFTIGQMYKANGKDGCK